jgi:hypothetical protein
MRATAASTFKAARAGRAEDVALVRRILQQPAGCVAFVPGGAGVEVWHTLPRLAAALRVMSPGRYAVVRLPAIDEDVSPRHEPPRFQTRPLGAELDELLLPVADSVVRAVAPLATVMEHARVKYAHILVDASGFLPDAPEVLELADAVVSVVAAGVTRESELLELVAMLPSDRHVGTLLLE